MNQSEKKMTELLEKDLAIVKDASTALLAEANLIQQRSAILYDRISTLLAIAQEPVSHKAKALPAKAPSRSQPKPTPKPIQRAAPQRNAQPAKASSEELRREAETPLPFSLTNSGEGERHSQEEHHE